MFKPGTLIVLGAGASVDLDFPLGAHLKTLIARALSVEHDSIGRPRWHQENERIFTTLIHNLPQNATRGNILDAARMVSSGIDMSSSVDNYLEMRKNELLISNCAKVAIASIILGKEQNATILSPHTPRFRARNNFDKKWHQVFAEICFEGATLDMVPEALSRVKVISFNYDRSFEQFVRVAIHKLYSCEWTRASELSRHIQIVHPYGSLGDLPGVGGNDSVEFGIDSISNLLPLAARIKTFTERITEEKKLHTIADMARASRRIIFLGFGFHRQNLEILDPVQNDSAKSIYGTAIGLAPAALQTVKSRLEHYFGRRKKSELLAPARVYLEPKGCLDLLSEYRLDLN